MPRDIRHFAFATLSPVPLLIAGALLGLWWNLAALAYIALVTAMADALAPRDGRVCDDIIAADILSTALGVVHFILLGFAVLSIAGPGSATAGDRITAFFAFGQWFGQTSNSNAHELIHRADRGLRRLGVWICISQL